MISGEALADMYRDWAKRYPIVSVEDPFDQDDWDSWVKYTASVNHQVVGDDLTVTNPTRIQMGIDKKACNCLLLKVNQVRAAGGFIRFSFRSEFFKLFFARLWGDRAAVIDGYIIHSLVSLKRKLLPWVFAISYNG